jgi:hypothetical protein
MRKEFIVIVAGVKRLAKACCLKLDKHCILLAFSLAFAKVGSSITARIAMMAMTTTSSIKVKPTLSVSQAELRLNDFTRQRDSVRHGRQPSAKRRQQLRHCRALEIRAEFTIGSPINKPPLRS